MGTDPIVGRSVRRSVEQRFVDGDRDALREIFDAHAGLVLSIARPLVGSEAEDLAQQVFLAAWRSRERFDADKGSLTSWLAGITRFKCIDHLRAKGSRPPAAGAAAADSTAAEGVTTSAVSQVADRMVIQQALEELNPDQRRAVELAYFGDLTHAQVSEQLGLPLGTVKTRIRSGLQALKRHLDDSRLDLLAEESS